MPRLVIRKGEGAGRDHALSGPCVVGRQDTAHFVLGDGLASRHHFRVVNEAGAWFVEDLGSTNGTLLNGRRVKREPLRDGDRVVAGSTELEFVQKDLLQATAAPRPAVVPAKPAAVPAKAAPPAPPAPAASAAPAKPKFQAPIPTKKRR